MIQEQPSSKTIVSAPRSAGHQSPWRTGAIVLTVAAIADLVILAVATVGGADMTVTPSGGSSQMGIGIGAILIALLLAVAGGTIVLAAAGKGRQSRWRLMATAGLALGVLSIAAPLTAEATIGTKLALSCMHLTAALTWYTTLRRAAP